MLATGAAIVSPALWQGIANWRKARAEASAANATADNTWVAAVSGLRLQLINLSQDLDAQRERSSKRQDEIEKLQGEIACLHIGQNESVNKIANLVVDNGALRDRQRELSAQLARMEQWNTSLIAWARDIVDQLQTLGQAPRRPVPEKPKTGPIAS